MPHSQKKISQICSEPAYQRLEAITLEKRKIGPYAVDFNKWIGLSTSHRNYLSKWLEKAITAILKLQGWNVEKKPDTGQRIDNRKEVTDILGRRRLIGSVEWVKSRHTDPGRADLYLEKPVGNGMRYVEWIEIKIGKDRQSPEQQLFEQRCQLNGERYTIIKTLDEFFEYYDNHLNNL
jgi:hypothetical protein